MAGLDLAQDWVIQPPATPDPPARLAARELQRILRRIAGRVVPLAGEPEPGRPVFRLSHGLNDGDGYSWKIEPGLVQLAGDSPRGLLYAVYDLLGELGCRWLGPGDNGERLPSATLFSVPKGGARETPALPGRCLVIGHHVFLRSVDDWVIWAARNRLNTIFIHTTGEPLALGSVSEAHWQSHKATALALADERGMVVEHGGHGLAALLPRSRFRGMPEAFRHDGDRRTPDHNFCPSSSAALDIVRENAAAHFKAHPEALVHHLWPDDIPGGGWCACPACRDLSPSDQALLAVNAAAEALEAADPKAVLAFLAYHDTEAAPRRVLPRRNVSLLWAPRRRCYGHAADDPACPVNSPHLTAALTAQLDHFAAAGAAPPRVFEYYLDGILFKSVLPPLPGVIQADLRLYRRLGVHTVQALMTGPRPWQAPEPNAWLFARLAWDPDQPREALLRDYCRSAFGDSGDDLPGYFHALEAAYALALDLSPDERMLVTGGPLHSLREPPCDMGDPSHAPTDVLLRKAQDNLAIEEWVRRAGRHLEAARSASYPAAWEAERAAFDLHAAWLSFDLARLQLLAATRSGLGMPGARALLGEAYRQSGLVQSWGRAHIPDRRHRADFRLQHLYFWRLRLDWIRGRHFSHALSRLFIRCGDLIRLLWYAMRLWRAYDRD